MSRQKKKRKGVLLPATVLFPDTDVGRWRRRKGEPVRERWEGGKKKGPISFHAGTVEMKMMS